MKNLKITKYERVENTDKEMLAKGIVAFQLVKFEIDFYGNVIESVQDTKIMADGRQLVIDGDGFIEKEFEVK